MVVARIRKIGAIAFGSAAVLTSLAYLLLTPSTSLRPIELLCCSFFVLSAAALGYAFAHWYLKVGDESPGVELALLFPVIVLSSVAVGCFPAIVAALSSDPDVPGLSFPQLASLGFPAVVFLGFTWPYAIGFFVAAMLVTSVGARRSGGDV